MTTPHNPKDEMPENCYPGYWLKILQESPFVPADLTERQIEKLSLKLAYWNSTSPLGANAMSKRLTPTNIELDAEEGLPEKVQDTSTRTGNQSDKLNAKERTHE